MTPFLVIVWAQALLIFFNVSATAHAVGLPPNLLNIVCETALVRTGIPAGADHKVSPPCDSEPFSREQKIASFQQTLFKTSHHSDIVFMETMSLAYKGNFYSILFQSEWGKDLSII